MEPSPGAARLAWPVAWRGDTGKCVVEDGGPKAGVCAYHSRNSSAALWQVTPQHYLALLNGTLPCCSKADNNGRAANERLCPSGSQTRQG